MGLGLEAVKACFTCPILRTGTIMESTLQNVIDRVATFAVVAWLLLLRLSIELDIEVFATVVVPLTTTLLGSWIGVALPNIGRRAFYGFATGAAISFVWMYEAMAYLG